MRQILLNGKYYKVIDEVTKRAINPWKAQVRSTGGREFSDFSQAEMEEYHDFRNGIGLESALPDDSARLWWTEGIDFSTARSAVLGPKVNTAGTFGAAPIKIWDFEDNTYAMSATTIKKWDNTSAWDTLGALVEDCEDAWNESVDGSVTSTLEATIIKRGSGSEKITATGNIIATLATEVISSTDLSDFTEIHCWLRSSVNKNLGDYQLLLAPDANCATPAESLDLPALTANTWKRATLTLANPGSDTAIISVGIKSIVQMNTGEILYIDQVVADVYIPNPIDAIGVTDGTDTYLVISAAADAAYYDETTWTYFDDTNEPTGYMAWYNTKLYSVSTDGKTLNASAANDVDGTWTTATLTGEFGIIYDAFEGKLLADGTPILYMCGTEGLFTIDVANSKAYKQEVSYPPLTYAGHKGMYWNANVWVAAGFGILKVTPSMATFVGPDQDDGLPSTYQGSIFDMVTVNNWLVFCVNKTAATDKSSILKRNSSYGGNLQVYTSAVDTAIACLNHSPSSQYTNGRLWFGEGDAIKYMMFPDTTSNVKQITSYEYVDDSGYGKLPIFRKLAAISKTALGVAAITKSCDTSEYVQVFYGLNGAAPTTSLGTFKDSPRATILTFGTLAVGVEFYTIQFAIKLFRGSTGTTPERNSPELESLMFYYLPTPISISAWIFVVECTDEDAAARIAEFEVIKALNTLVVFNPTGDALKTAFNYNVKLTQMPMRFYVENQGTRETKGIEVVVEQIFEG